MHIVEQEQDRVQSVVLFGLALFSSAEGRNTGKEKHGGKEEITQTSCLFEYQNIRLKMDRLQ